MRGDPTLLCRACACPMRAAGGPAPSRRRGPDCASERARKRAAAGSRRIAPAAAVQPRSKGRARASVPCLIDANQSSEQGRPKHFTGMPLMFRLFHALGALPHSRLPTATVRAPRGQRGLGHHKVAARGQPLPCRALVRGYPSPRDCARVWTYQLNIDFKVRSRASGRSATGRRPPSPQCPIPVVAMGTLRASARQQAAAVEGKGAAGQLPS
jgi:hypothetical protein